VLRFQAKARVLAVNVAARAGERAVKKVAGVELNAGLVGRHGQRAPALRLVNFRSHGPVGKQTFCRTKLWS